MLARTGRCTSTRTTRIPRRCAAKSRRCSAPRSINVVVRTFAGPGHYGRSNGGNAGAEDEAVILSKAVGKPVRVQWMRAEDFQWSTQIARGVFGRRNRTGRERQDGRLSDRPLHARDAGRPAGRRGARRSADDAGSQREARDFIGSTVKRNSDPWVYDGVANLIERGHGTFQVGQKASPLAVGLRDHSMRTPGQFQQNFPRELAISEAAALAGADAIQFRIDHAKEERVIGVLKAVREASGWETRPSPHANPVSTGDARRCAAGASR